MPDRAQPAIAEQIMQTAIALKLRERSQDVPLQALYLQTKTSIAMGNLAAISNEIGRVIAANMAERYCSQDREN